MRETIRIWLAAVLVTSSLPAVFAQSEIAWLSNIYEAQQIARQQQRLILVHFYSDTCLHCQRLEQIVFPNPNVYHAMSMNYVPVKINGDRARDLAVKYQVDRWPTDVITDPQGRILYKTVSPQDPARYVQLLNAVSADFRAANSAATVAARTPPQGVLNSATPYAAYDNRADPRSQFAAYTPAAAQSVAPASPSSGPYYPQVSNPREQLNPYAVSTGAGASAAAVTPTGAYDPRSAWSAAGSESESGFAPAALSPAASQGSYSPSQPASPPFQPTWSPSQPTWQENRFYSDPTATGSSQVAAAPQVPATSGTASAPIAMDGFCPVTLAEQERWAKGDPRWGVVHRGRTYLLLSQQHQQRFLGDPDRYSPVLSGYDPVRYVDRGELVPGQRRHGMWFRGKIYLFADEESLNRFSAGPDTPEVYARRAHDIMMAAGRN